MAAPQRQQELQRFFPQLRRMMQSPVAAAILNQTMGGITPPTQPTPYGPVGGLLDQRAGVPLQHPGIAPGLTWQALAGIRGRGPVMPPPVPMATPMAGMPQGGLLQRPGMPLQPPPMQPMMMVQPPLAGAGRALSPADREYIEALAAARRTTPGRLFDVLFSNEPVMWRKPEAWTEQ